MEQVKKKRAVFLDRDGTIIEDAGHLDDTGKVEYLPGCFEALRRLQERFELFIITNQSGVAKKIISMEGVEEVNNAVLNKLREEGIEIRGTYVCPHSREDLCECIKPKGYFLRKAEKEYGIDLGGSFAVGDHPHDAELAENVGGTGVYVLTGHGVRHLAELERETVIVEDIKGACDYILKKDRGVEAGEDEDVRQAAEVLLRGGLVAFPTETVYGLGASGFNPKAVAGIFDAKQRPFFDPLILHISSIGQLEKLVESVPDDARRLVEEFWPGPLTVVLKKSALVPDIVTSGLDSVAVRMPGHPLALKLLREVNVPVAAPSANLFGHTSPTMAKHVRKQLKNKIDMILDGGRCRVGVESTIISFAGDGEKPVILRHGGVEVERIRELIGEVEDAESVSEDKPMSPGRTLDHYSPRTPLVLWEEGKDVAEGKSIGLICFKPVDGGELFEKVEVLSERGDLSEAAAKLFSAIHELDESGLDVIYATKVPDEGLGRAINDRLYRASEK